MKETIVASQDCPKLLGTSVTCGSQRVKERQTRKNIDPEIINKFAVGIKKFWT